MSSDSLTNKQRDSLTHHDLKSMSKRKLLKTLATGVPAAAILGGGFFAGISTLARANTNSWAHQITVNTPMGFSGTPAHPTLHYSSATSGAKLRWPGPGQANTAKAIVEGSVDSYNSFYTNLFRLAGASNAQITASGQYNYKSAILGSSSPPNMVPGSGVEPNWAEVTNMISQYVNNERSIGVFPTKINTTWLSNGQPATWIETLLLGENGTSTLYITDPLGNLVTLTRDTTGITGMTFSGPDYTILQSEGWLNGLKSFLGQTLGFLGSVGFVYFADIPTAGELPGQLYGLPGDDGLSMQPYVPYYPGLDGTELFDMPPTFPTIQYLPTNPTLNETSPGQDNVGTAYNQNTIGGTSTNQPVVGIWYGGDISDPGTGSYDNTIAVEGQIGSPITIKLGAGGAQDQLHQLI